MSQFSWENEWRLQKLKEESFMVGHIMDKTPGWVKFVEKKVPATLQKTLETAFTKAFVTVFEKGSGLIEKTYRKQRHERLFREHERDIHKEGFNGKSLRRFERQAKRTAAKNLTITTVEGIGFGIVGLGIPDIPIFVSVMLKSIYEIALSYGFSYSTDKEKLFILKLIDAALKSGETLRKKDKDMNKLIRRYFEEEETAEAETDPFVVELQIKRQIDSSAEALSHELLYGKFLQGSTFIGVIGGTADFTCLKRITDYGVFCCASCRKQWIRESFVT